MDLKFSCADFAFPLLSHDTALDLIAAMGFSGVDIGLFEDRTHLQPHDQFDSVPMKAKLLKERLDKRGLKAADIFIQASLDFTEYAVNHPDKNRRDKARTLFLNTLEYASLAGSSHVSCLPGVAFSDSEEYEASFDRCAEELLWRLEEAESAGLLFGVEAHVGSIVEEPAKAKVLMDAVPGLGLTLDYSHFVRLGMEDAEADILLPYANHFHARGAADGRLQTSVKESEIDFFRIIKGLKAQNYGGWITLEYCWTPEWEDCARNDNISETIILMEDLVRAFYS